MRHSCLQREKGQEEGKEVVLAVGTLRAAFRAFDPVKYFYSLPPSFIMFLQSADRVFPGFLTDLTPHLFSELLPHIHLSFILPRSPLSTVEHHLATLILSNIFFLFFSLSHWVHQSISTWIYVSYLIVCYITSNILEVLDVDIFLCP